MTNDTKVAIASSHHEKHYNSKNDTIPSEIFCKQMKGMTLEQYDELMKDDFAEEITGEQEKEFLLWYFDNYIDTEDVAAWLVNHILAMKTDAYLSGHPEWHEIVSEAQWYKENNTFKGDEPNISNIGYAAEYHAQNYAGLDAEEFVILTDFFKQYNNMDQNKASHLAEDVQTGDRWDNTNYPEFQKEQNDFFLWLWENVVSKDREWLEENGFSLPDES